ncbi:DUF4136 domain-containing protein [Parerythrobacter aurantius]|uniref:DUF4136 domain-containing protein n=1 Tax=Parerythrobacter aurantius TaxID=3127706 RepID=UPI00324AF54E
MTAKTTLTRRLMQAAAVPLMLVTLGGCATAGFKSDVTRFTSQLPAPQGQTFAVVADDPALAGGLEFSQYAQLVTARMAQLGYVPASPDSADLLVRFDYGVDQGREKVRTTGFYDPFYSSWYGFHPRSRFGYRSRFYPSRFRSAWGYGFYDPWFGGPDVVSYTVYTSGIDMKIDRRATGERLFEGKAEALSTSNRLRYLVPNLVEAMFTDFPGNSGETLRISIAPEKTTVKRVD